LAQEQAVRRQAEEDARLAAQRQRELDEIARRQAEQRAARLQAEQEAARRRAEDETRLAAQRQRELEEAERRRSEQLAQQRRAEDEAARRQAEAVAAQRRAEELAQQQAAQRRTDELAREQADRLARERADQDARRAAEQASARQPTLSGGVPPGGAGAGSGAADGAGGGTGGRGTLPRSTLGSDLGSRARELVRGLDVLGAAPPAVRPRPQERRAVASGAERDVPLRMYVDSIRQKLERNGMLNRANLSVQQVRIDPLVSVTLRSDGSVDDVTILRSSGHPDTDEAVRRIVRLNARYSVFPPNVAAIYDVIEIRRIWSFADGLKLLEEVR
jgi:TonB family protein